MLHQGRVMKEISLWVSKKEKYWSFRKKDGYSREKFSTNEEMWITVHNLIDCGYKVQ